MPLFAKSFNTPVTESIPTITSADLQQTAPTPAPQPAPAPAPQAEQKPAAPKAPAKSKKFEYVPPKDAAEAKQRILACIEKGSVAIEQPQGDPVRFKGATYGLRTEFRALGGEFKDGFWTVPAAAWADPSVAVPTKSEKTIANEQARAEEAAKAEAEKQAAIAAAVADALAKATPENMITIEQAKANTLKALKLMLSALSSTNDVQLNKCIDKAYAA